MTNRLVIILVICIFSISIMWIFSPSEGSDKPEDGLLSSQEPVLQEPPATQTLRPTQDPETITPNPQESLFHYRTEGYETSDGPVLMHLLSIDLKNPDVTVKPVLSHRTLFGYEYLSVMAEKYGAIAAVNGGFSYSNGLPGGMVYSNKELKTPASGKFPVLFITEDSAYISDATQDIWLESEGKELSPVFYNNYSEWGGIFAYTPAYGSTDRIKKPHLTAQVQNGIVTEVKNVRTEQAIPQDGFLVGVVGADVQKRFKDFVETGMKLELKTKLSIAEEADKEYLSAYECGSWLIKDGVNVCPKEDAWAGNLTGRAPRTAVGIKQDGTLIFVVVDGRQKDISVGAGGPELAEKLLSLGIHQAALLDGGASSEMIIGDEIVNSPSAGRERMLFSCFVILEK